MRYLSSSESKLSRQLPKLLLLAALCAALSIVWRIGTMHETTFRKIVPTAPETAEDYRADFPYLLITWADMSTATQDERVVDLSAYADECRITEGGDVRLTGSLTGRVSIDVEEQNVHILLDNVSITSQEGPAVYVESANKVVITVLPDTDNTISDSGDYRDSDLLESCIYSNCDLTINGTGKLAVNGYYKDAIRSKDVVKIMDTDLTIKCKRTGVHGTDGIHVVSGNIFISSEKNGFKTTKSGADGRGTLMISGGEHTVIAGRYTFVCERGDLYVFDCIVRNKSVVDTYEVNGQKVVQRGCVQ